MDSTPDRSRVLVVRNDGVNRTQDSVVVYIDAVGTRSSAQWFHVNAAGGMDVGLNTVSDDSAGLAPDFHWDWPSARNPQGWTAVMRLPFASLRASRTGASWLRDACRVSSSICSRRS